MLNSINSYGMNAQTTLAWAAVVAAAVITAACGGGSHDGSAAKSGNVHVPANFCGLLSGADISEVMGRAFPAPQGTQSASEAQCNAVPSAGNDVSFKLYYNDLYCVDGQPANQQCLDSQSKGFATNKQTAGQAQNIPGLGEQAFCFVTPPATVDVLKGWIYLTVAADSCVQAQTLAGMLLAKISA
jgi:predicted small secreted protein